MPNAQVHPRCAVRATMISCQTHTAAQCLVEPFVRPDNGALCTRPRPRPSYREPVVSNKLFEE